jgi:hypothetical protein
MQYQKIYEYNTGKGLNRLGIFQGEYNESIILQDLCISSLYVFLPKILSAGSTGWYKELSGQEKTKIINRMKK